METNQKDNIKTLTSYDLDKNHEIVDNIKDFFTCWICLELAEHPLFCPNKNCMKGVHENCINKSNEEDIKCICGNKYKKEEWKPNSYIETISCFALSADKTLKKLESKKCPIHKDELLKHYCYECKNVYCGTCIITTKEDNHKNHRLINFEKFNEIEKEIKFNTEYLQKEVLEIDDSYRKYITLKTDFLTNLKDWIKKIEKKGNKIQKRVEENKKKIEEILNKIKHNYNEWINSLDKNKYNDISNVKEIKSKLVINLNIKNNELFNETKEIKNYLKCKIEDFNRKTPKLLNLIKTKYVIKIYEDGKYEGDLLNKKKEGKGVFSYNNGDKYDGEWVNDNAEGKGIFYQNDGDVFEGEWKNDKRNGRGIFYTTNGYNYDGEWANDQKNGKGKLYWNDGDIFDGEWKNDEKDGLGICIYNDGEKEVKIYKNDESERVLLKIKTDGEIQFIQ